MPTVDDATIQQPEIGLKNKRTAVVAAPSGIRKVLRFVQLFFLA
jgi:hypothetical protein